MYQKDISFASIDIDMFNSPQVKVSFMYVPRTPGGRIALPELI